MEENSKIIHNFGDKKVNFGFKPQHFTNKKSMIIIAAFLFLGVLTGYFIAGSKSSSSVTSTNLTANPDGFKKGDIIGIKDEKTFKDSVEGELKVGGIEGQGAYHLERPGGESQNVYMTSSVLDLSKFVGKKVKVWGQTQQSDKAGWLMDVGRLQLLE